MFLSKFGATAQEVATKYLVIDTIVIGKKYKSEPDFEPTLISTNDAYSLYSRYSDSVVTTIDFNVHPNFSAIIKYDKRNTFNLGLRIDDKGSKIWFNHFERSPDTLHIYSWNLLHNALPDSVFNHVKYYHYTGDSMINMYKEKATRVLVGKNNDPEYNDFKFVVNGIPHTVELKPIYAGGSVTTYQGNVGRGRRKYRKHNIKHKRFAGRSVRSQKLYTGSLNF